jgi:ATP-dependent Clp protease ATP-binding subunit ClpC
LASVFERFTNRARRVLVLAQEEARLQTHSWIGTEHILIGIVSEGHSGAAQVLQSLGIKLADVREKVQATVAMSGLAGAPHEGSPPFSPRAKKVLELSQRESLALGHDFIGPEHMLLALVAEGEGIGAQVLDGLGADAARTRQRVVNVLRASSGSEEVMAGTAASAEVQAMLERLIKASEAPPDCPHCSSPLASYARLRRLEVPDDERGASSLVLILYCSSCGKALQFLRD